MGSLGTHRKRERWQGQGWGDKTGPVKEDVGLGCPRPGSPCQNQPGRPEAFKGGSSESQERWPCQSLEHHYHQAHFHHGRLWPTQISLFNYFPSQPLPSLFHLCNTCLPYTTSCLSSWPITLGADSPPPPPLPEQTVFLKMATTISLMFFPHCDLDAPPIKRRGLHPLVWNLGGLWQLP